MVWKWGFGVTFISISTKMIILEHKSYILVICFFASVLVVTGFVVLLAAIGVSISVQEIWLGEKT